MHQHGISNEEGDRIMLSIPDEPQRQRTGLVDIPEFLEVLLTIESGEGDYG